MKPIMYVAAAAGLLVAVTGTAHASGNADDGKTKAAQCATCHGTDGKGGGPNPPIIALDATKFVVAMNEYKSGKRKHPMMEMLAKKLNDQDMADLASYYATLK